MKNIIRIVILSTSISFFSCKKDKKVEPDKESTNLPSTTYSNYSNLKVGNYWIYQRFEIDSSGNATPLAIVDSCYIEKDTLIHGNTYYKYMSPNFGNSVGPNSVSPNVAEFYRDSLSYIITNSGRIEFSSQDFTSIFKSGYQLVNPNDTVCRFEFKMGNQNTLITTPSGTYNTSSFNETYYMYPNYSAGGTIRTRHTRYAENVGKVTQEWYFFVSLPTKWERRLIRYHLN